MDATATAKEESPYLLPQDGNSGFIVSPHFEGTNYAAWSRSFVLPLTLRSKVGFVDGTILKPSADDSLFSIWNCCNSLDVAWLIRSISQPIVSELIYIDSAHEIWELLKSRFTQPDLVMICHLQQQLHSTFQDNRPIQTYFSQLNSIWRELSSLRPFPKCKCGNKAIMCL
ncbi:hypothetical protein MLD38_033634 [Melastoma candidum]|uniref:Uncharacterized protein n=1 Tax=Melastoma candidum TaxID=119954 RepID=A0ACB9M7W0_9MYRT|nr:hypothetical protein MLD38_033634 [Melastoma candidum]